MTEATNSPIEPKFLKYTSKMDDAQLRIFYDACVAAGTITTDGDDVIDAQNIAELLESKDQIDLVMACSDISDSKILEILMGEPLNRGPASRTDSPRTGRDKSDKGPKAPKAEKVKLVAGVVAPAPDDPRVFLTVKPNPKKPSSGAFQRYALYKVSMSIAEFIKAGGTKADIKYDLEHGFITIGEAEAVGNDSAE